MLFALVSIQGCLPFGAMNQSVDWIGHRAPRLGRQAANLTPATPDWGPILPPAAPYHQIGCWVAPTALHCWFRINTACTGPDALGSDPVLPPASPDWPWAIFLCQSNALSGLWGSPQVEISQQGRSNCCHCSPTPSPPSPPPNFWTCGDL